jgi:hypothetical protein
VLGARDDDRLHHWESIIPSAVEGHGDGPC